MLGRGIAVAAGFGLIVAIAGCASEPAADAVPHITIASEHCGAGWITPHAGPQQFLLENSDIVAGEAYLVNAATGAVYAYVDNLGPGATATLRVSLRSGRYAFRCAMSDRGVADGASVTVPGSAAGHSAVVAVSEQDLIPLAIEYDRWVHSQLPQLGRQVTALRDDLAAGNVQRARADWLRAHLSYERLGAAYGSFGDADAAINGLAEGLPGGVSDSAFGGFHRIEYGLWQSQSASELEPIATKLVRDVDSLSAVLTSTSVSALDLGLRCHEITENALQFDLTGQTDFGSGTSLASVSAELDGTTELLQLLTPLLTPRYPELGEAASALAAAKADVAAQHTGSTWTPLNRLDRQQRERLNADLSGLATLLAPIAAITEPRTTS